MTDEAIIPARGGFANARLLERAARRVMLGAARRIRVGRLTVVLPDGSRRTYGDPASPHAGEIHVHDTRGRPPDAAGRRDRRRRGVHGRPVVQPGPAGAAQGGRTQPGCACVAARLVARAAQAAEDDRPPPSPQHGGREPPEHRGPLRPRQRLLPAVPRRVDDLLERRLRFARPDPRGRAAQQIRRDGGARRSARRRARARDRQRLGWLRAVCRGRARLPGHHDHRVAGPAPARDGARRSWPGCPTA